MIKAVTKLFIDAFIHPIFTLFVAAIFKIAVFFHEVNVFVNHIPDLLHSQVIKTGVSQYFGNPSGFRRRKQMQCITELSGSQLGTFQIISIGLIDNDTIRHLHNTTLNPLQFIARTGQLNQQEEINHRVNSRFALSHSYGLHKNLIESGSFTKNNRLTCFTCHSSQRTG